MKLTSLLRKIVNPNFSAFIEAFLTRRAKKFLGVEKLPRNNYDRIGKKTILNLDKITLFNSESKYKKLYLDALQKSGCGDNILRRLRFFNLYSFIESILIKELEGDFAECGCWNGNSLFSTKELIDKNRSKKKIYVFDSFEGLSDFTSKDIENSSMDEELRKFSKIRHKSNYERLIFNLKGKDNIILRKGWIPEIFLEEENRKYCFVHIDLDLYEPTKASLFYFFDRLSKGGMIVCDDYGSNAFPGAKRAVDEFLSVLNKGSYSYFFQFSAGGCLLIK